jgi:hypothetical protein
MLYTIDEIPYKFDKILTLQDISCMNDKICLQDISTWMTLPLLLIWLKINPYTNYQSVKWTKKIKGLDFFKIQSTIISYVWGIIKFP